MSAPACTVVVATARRPGVLAGCLDALGRLEGPDFELVVVDNTEGEAEVGRLAAAAGARLVVEPRPGASRARNAGARVARGAIVAFTDDDARPRPDWLARHADALADPSLSATAGRVLPWPADAPAARAYLAAGGEDVGARAFRIDRTVPEWFARTNFGGVGIGPNMAFRRWLFDTGWGFRVGLGTGAGPRAEEGYAFYTLVRDGHAVAYLPEAVVDHLVPGDVAQQRTTIVRAGAQYALLLLLEERGHRRDVLAFLAGALRGRRRAWRPPAAEPLAGGGDRLAAALRAPLDLAAWRVRLGGAAADRPPRIPGPLGLE